MDKGSSIDESEKKDKAQVQVTEGSVKEDLEVSKKPEETPEDKRSEEKKLVKKIPKNNMKQTTGIVIGAVLVVLAGVGTGWALSGGTGGLTSRTEVSEVAPGAEESETEAGIADEETFRDSAEGILLKGGIDGEGTHHLDRGLGPSKDVYLTSTVIDLQSFVDKKVMVWGETISAKHAGWLMDVGKIKVVE